MAEGKDTKHGGHRNGKKGVLSGSSFFTWFMVIALLGVWTSVAVVWFDLVDYEEVLGKLGVYDADGDGDFDVDDAKVLLEGPGGVAKRKTKAKGLKERSPSRPTVGPEEAEAHAWLKAQAPEGSGEDLQEEDGPTREQQPEDDDFLVGSDMDDRFESLETGTLQEETKDSYHAEETASQVYNQDTEDMMYKQEDSDSSEPVIDDDERTYHDADDVTYQDHDQQVYEPPESEGIESSDNAVEDSNIILEEAHASPAEEQQEIPPDT
ncbi:aspartate beta-hydroxylase [Phyllostomus discolor]|uniref:Aspartate beta-hydroxylase n=1 Tax=Phyllostomus discolor TaxID=89673 RepID=A0A833ZVW7_9CHIR|nr:aspartate beta-hydroxylase [Phyllostomus discolor]